ncbi:hypothetical protein ABEB36_004607 [Hypothenemus hampei]|uniref:Uncharacterized protein n=1 Tax=Hypothenemus hampei TaxID=57062 RepID=A0ABD1F3V6_HYPHA
MSYWEEVVAVLRTVPEISEWFEAEDPANLKEITRVTLEIWKEATLYQGFDVYRIIKLLRANYQAYMASLLEEQVSYEVTVNGTKKTFRYSNNEKLTTDIHFILFLFANRGCSVQKVLEKSTDQIRTVMDWLISKLNLDITENEPGRSLGPDIITIPRIAACFPTVFCNVFHARESCTGQNMTCTGHHDEEGRYFVFGEIEKSSNNSSSSSSSEDENDEESSDDSGIVE